MLVLASTCALQDPVSRRKMWNIIARVASERKICSVILTTHSMEECEALCSRLGIMVDGALQCLGSIQHLKAKFGTGFSAEFKLGDPSPQLLSTVTGRLAGALNGRTTVDLLSVPALCANVGLPQRAVEISASGTGECVVVVDVDAVDVVVVAAVVVAVVAVIAVVAVVVAVAVFQRLSLCHRCRLGHLRRTAARWCRWHPVADVRGVVG